MTPEDIVEIGRATGVYDLMHTAWGWPVVESIHYVSLAVLLGTIGFYDLRALGVGKGFPLYAIHRLAPLGAAAFAVNLATGVLFFLSEPGLYLYNPSFQLKVACILLAGVNMAAFYALAGGRALEGLDARASAPPFVKLTAAVSLTCWILVIVFGRLITYFKPPYHWCFWC